MASEDFIQAVNEHVMGDCSEFTALKKRFKDFDTCADQPAAAALGYLIAKDELGAAKEEEEELDVYDEVVAIINRFDNQRVNSLSPHSATDQIFTLIYKWLDKSLAANNYPPMWGPRVDVEDLFLPFVIEESEA